MGILEQQIVIGDKIISNDIKTDAEARSVTMKNGYFSERRYPDNRTTMTGINPFSNESIAASATAGQIG